LSPQPQTNCATIDSSNLASFKSAEITERENLSWDARSASIASREIDMQPSFKSANKSSETIPVGISEADSAQSSEVMVQVENGGQDNFVGGGGNQEEKVKEEGEKEKGEVEDKYIRHGPLLIKVVIEYLISEELCTGLVFRKANNTSEVVGVHTVHNSNTSLLYNPDGVRTWLPSLDESHQRGVFDVSITAPSDFSVVCSGQRLSIHAQLNVNKNIPHSNVNQNPSMCTQEALPHRNMTTHRFITTNRIPAYALGFFIGRVERYALPLHLGIAGKIWLASSSNRH